MAYCKLNMKVPELKENSDMKITKSSLQKYKKTSDGENLKGNEYINKN